MSSTNSCENCGTAFESSGELTGSKVLCPTCAAERRAQIKAAKSAPAGARAPARAATAAAAASPAPAAPPRARAAAPAPVERPARQRTQGARTRTRDQDLEEPGHHHLDGHQLHEADAKRMAKFGWLAVGALTLVTLLVLVFVMNKQNDRKAKEEAYQKELRDFRAQIMAVPLTNEEAIKQGKEEIAAKRPLWHGTAIDADIVGRLADFNRQLAIDIKTRTLTAKLDDIQAKIAGSPSLDTMSQQFAAVRDPDLAQQATEAGGQYKTRYDQMTQAVTERYLSTLKTAVAGAASATTREGLAPYGLYEDALRTVLNDAQAASDAPAIQQYGTALRQVVREVNDLVTARFDEAFIKNAPSKNLFEVPGDWLEVKSPSFKYNMGSGGPLTLTNEAGEGASSGGLSYKPGDHWRDYVLEMDFKLDSGTMVVYTRVGEKMDLKAVPGFTIGTVVGTHTPNLVIEYGKPMQLVVSTIGSRLSVTTPDGTSLFPPDELTSAKSRVGEPGIVAQPGTKATITRLRVRVLR